MNTSILRRDLKKNRSFFLFVAGVFLSLGGIVFSKVRFGNETSAFSRSPRKPGAQVRGEALVGRPWNGGKARSGPNLFEGAGQKLTFPSDQSGVTWRLSVQIPPDCQSVEVAFRGLNSGVTIEGPQEQSFSCEASLPSALERGQAQGEELFFALEDSRSTGDVAIDWTIVKKGRSSLQGTDLIRLEREVHPDGVQSPGGSQKASEKGTELSRDHLKDPGGGLTGGVGAENDPGQLMVRSRSSGRSF